MKVKKVNRKPICIFLAILFSVLSTSYCNAINFMPTLETGMFKTGFEISFGSQDFEIDEIGKNESDINRYYLGGEYAISKKISVYGIIGLTDIQSDGFNAPSLESDGRIKFEPDPGISYGLGLKAAFIEEEKFRFGLSVQISKFSIDKENISDPEGFVLTSGGYFQGAYWLYGYNAESEGTAYNICLGGNYYTDMDIVFYGGLYFSKIDIDFTMERVAPEYEIFEGYNDLSSYGKEDFINAYNDRLNELGFSGKKQEKDFDLNESDPVGIVFG